MKVLRRLLVTVFAILALAAAGGLLSVALLPYSADNIYRWPTSPVLLDRKGGVFAVFLSEDSEWSIPVPLSRMGRWLPLIATEVEDRRFRDHGGVDWAAILRASVQNAAAGRVVSGASTITSQLVRLSQPRPRTVKTKPLGVLRRDKNGKPLFKGRNPGDLPEQGSLRRQHPGWRQPPEYFSKSAAEVSLSEAALLVGMLKGPSVSGRQGTPEGPWPGETPYWQTWPPGGYNGCSA